MATSGRCGFAALLLLIAGCGGSSVVEISPVADMVRLDEFERRLGDRCVVPETCDEAYEGRETSRFKTLSYTDRRVETTGQWGIPLHARLKLHCCIDARTKVDFVYLTAEAPGIPASVINLQIEASTARESFEAAVGLLGPMLSASERAALVTQAREHPEAPIIRTGNDGRWSLSSRPGIAKVFFGGEVIREGWVLDIRRRRADLGSIRDKRCGSLPDAEQEPCIVRLDRELRGLPAE
jgi:hypothetical protein